MNGSFSQSLLCLDFQLDYIAPLQREREEVCYLGSRDPQKTCTVEKMSQSERVIKISQGNTNKNPNQQTKSNKPHTSKFAQSQNPFYYYDTHCFGMFETVLVCKPKLNCCSSFTQEVSSKDNFSSNRILIMQLSK